jgi:uncharacterized membrane protein YeaQ/YmgE (transglycosylase-associated protein family)
MSLADISSKVSFMPSWELAPSAQYWITLVLIWVGFGALAGLIARLLLPFRRPEGPAGTIALGIVGSAAGLLTLSFLRTDQQLNPISPIGFGAAVAGAFVLLVLYQLLGLRRRVVDDDPGAD